MTHLDLPYLSVIIPTLNEATFLRTCLETVVAAAASAPPTEILVVDGGSRDATLDIAAAYANRYSNVRVLRNTQGTTAAGFNVGIRAARAPYIAIVSAHSEVDRGFFRAALTRLDEEAADIVGGPIETQPGDPGRLSWLLAQAVSHPFGVGNSRFRVSQRAAYVDAVPFAVFRREVFERVGLFDEGLLRNQDTEFFGRVARAGFRVLLDPRVKSRYNARSTVRGLLVQGFRNAYWNVRVWRQTPGAFRWRHAIPGTFALGFWCLALLSPFSRLAAVGEIALLTAYAAAAGTASIHIALRTRRPLALILPPFFLVYHLTYGSGSLAGVRWLLRSPASRALGSSTSPLRPGD